MKQNSHDYILTKAFVVALVLSLAVGACEDTRPLQVRYNAEKALFEANKEREKLQIKPEFATEEQIVALRERYQTVMLDALNSADSLDSRQDSTAWRQLQLIAFEAAQRAEEIALERKDYQSAQNVISALLARATLPPQKLLTARLQLGKALQFSGQWDSAKVIYDDLVSAFYPPLDSKGNVLRAVLELPYNEYQMESDLIEGAARDSLVTNVENYYVRLLSSYPSGNLAVSIHALLSVFYQQEERFEKALEQLELVIDSTGHKALQAKIRSWDINTFSLNRPRVSLDDIEAQRLTGDDTLYIPLLYFKKAEAYLQKKNYDSCRSAIYTIKNDFPQYFGRNAVAQNLIAKSFAEEGKWDRAENEYRWMIETFPNAQVSFRAHIVILKHYKKVRNDRSYREWQERAVDFYKKAARRGAGSALEATAYSFIAEVYRLAENWSDAAKTLKKIARKFQTSEIGRRSALSAALLYRDKLADTAAADSLFEVFKSSWPESGQ